MSKVAIIGLSGDSLFYDLDHLPEKGETVHANILHREVGGKGFNQAVALARQGVEVYFLGAVGNDDIGNKCEEFLKSTQGKKYKIYLEIICCGSKKKNNYINHWKDKKGFICSSLIMGAYLQMGICDYIKNINQFLPGDFSQDKKLPFTSKFELGPEIIIDFSL